MAPVRQIEALIPLQEMDLQVHRLRVQRAEKPRQLAGHEERVARARSNADAIHEEIKALKFEGQKREHTVKEYEDKITKLQGQSMLARKNDEYQTFQKEISGQRADKGRVEDGLLDIYLQIDEKLKLEKVRVGEVRQAEGECDTARKAIEAEMAGLDLEIAELEGRRSGRLQGVDKELLRQYERVLEAKDDGVALAVAGKYETIEEEGKVLYWQCEGCNVGLTSQDVNLLLAGRETVICRNCSRILYIRASEPAAPTPAP